MSRAGKYPVEIKNGVSVEMTDSAVRRIESSIKY